MKNWRQISITSILLLPQTPIFNWRVLKWKLSWKVSFKQKEYQNLENCSEAKAKGKKELFKAEKLDELLQGLKLRRNS